jgi:ThiF family
MHGVFPQSLDAEAFYTQRDSRAGLEYPLSRVAPRHIALVVPPNTASSRVGVEIALFWISSIIRRMGRPFAEVILVASDEFRASESRLAGIPGVSIEQFVSGELTSADPFGGLEWRAWAKDLDLADASAIVWLGTLPLEVRHPRTLAINAHGWIALLHEPPDAELALNPPDFDAAPAAIVFAACMAAAKLFSEAFNTADVTRQIAFALDSGRASSDPVVYAKWFANGISLLTAPPWKAEGGLEPFVKQLLVVSAGGIGSNFCKIIGNSYFRVGSAYVVDPDNFDISNLNRAIGVGVGMVGSSKALFAAGALRSCVENPMPVQASYESWVTPDITKQFRLEDAAVVVGVDQVRTRLMVGSDWPWMLVNGATAGATFSTSMHLRLNGGCIGCWYGQSDARFAATRMAMACVAGVAAGVNQAQLTASYPFVSVAASAQIVAMLACAVYQQKNRHQEAGTVISMSLRTPENVRVQRIEISERCLLLCSEDYLQASLGRGATEGLA